MLLGKEDAVCEKGIETRTTKGDHPGVLIYAGRVLEQDADISH